MEVSFKATLHFDGDPQNISINPNIRIQQSGRRKKLP